MAMVQHSERPVTDPFMIRALVADFDEQQAGYKAMSNAARAKFRSQLDIAYGEGERERLDLFFPPATEGPRPVHIFIHGGYWRANVKEDYAFIAETVVGAGAIAAIIEYALMPGTRMPAIVEQVRRAAEWVADNAAGFGGDPAAISASGQSAGGHLASYLAAQAPHERAPPGLANALLLVSALYDLRPIADSFLQAEIGLTQEEIANWSPFEAQQDPGVPITIAVGHDETEPFHIQAQDFCFAAERRGARVTRVTIPELNHMNIVRDLGIPRTPMAKLLVETIARSRR